MDLDFDQLFAFQLSRLVELVAFVTPAYIMSQPVIFNIELSCAFVQCTSEHIPESQISPSIRMSTSEQFVNNPAFSFNIFFRIR